MSFRLRGRHFGCVGRSGTRRCIRRCGFRWGSWRDRQGSVNGAGGKRAFALSEGALRAARKALQGSGIPPQALGALVYGGVCREQFEPATACKIAAGIGLSDEAMVYDISNACLGVLNGLLDIANRIALGQIRCGMVVSCESAREINEQTIAELRQQPNDRERWMQSIATLTGGSGAIALILSDGSFHHYARPRLHSATCLSAPHLHDLCRWGVESDGTPFGLHQYARTDAVGVLKNGVALGMRTWERFLAEAQWRPESIDRVICHQVGERISARSYALCRSILRGTL